MKFLIQKINNQIRHDFSFTLLESVRFHNWLTHGMDRMIVRYQNTEVDDTDVVQPFEFKKYHRTYIPIGSVEFVTQFLNHFHNLSPKPINVPTELYRFAQREIFNGTNMDLEGLKGKWVVKDNEKIKGLVKMVEDPDILSVPPNGKYQISEYITIESEWRVFVYKGKLVGLQHYVGEFTMFPNVRTIKRMIDAYKNSPIAYTLDVGVSGVTFPIEVHDFFSCGLYGFSNHAILPYMFGRWFTQYVNKNGTARRI